MALTRVVGDEGDVTFASGFAITANAWSMSISRVVNEVSAFDDTSGQFRGGVPTYSGSVSGFMDSLAAGAVGLSEPHGIPDNLLTGTFNAAPTESWATS